MENFEKCIVARRAVYATRHGWHVTAKSAPKCYNVGFDHGLPCRVKNMARGTQ